MGAQCGADPRLVAVDLRPCGGRRRVDARCGNSADLGPQRLNFSQDQLQHLLLLLHLQLQLLNHRNEVI